MSKLGKLLKRIYCAVLPKSEDLEEVLSLNAKADLAKLFFFADKTREKFCGNGIVLRGIIEFSNFCQRDCFYCGLNKNNRKLQRYRISKLKLFNAVKYLVSCGIQTVVLQSGEDLALDAAWLGDLIKEIKSNFNIAVTLCVGERKARDYKIWRLAGADRYLLKIETSDEKLYSSMHPRMDFKNRLNCLRVLKELGYQVGSGNLIGLPGQTLKNIAQDIIFFKRNDFDMIGIGPFIAHKHSQFAGKENGDVGLVLKTIALTRIVTKNAHLPATTALGSLDRDYRLEGLKCGANVLMPNFTPQAYRKLYEIYPQKRCVNEPVGACNFCMDKMAKKIGRFIDYSKADSFKGRFLI
ncbi:MAG: [FeFe] hydrogenase H-cluster radical SAM maturase HydE [Candidatus Omnitrophica bacterium]|jgi:biotin synthase|nr:[FeFe] hydrogenase H-cluster radical SAM maturase HydE [Candidatus Omnitrophota bacterium]